MTERRDRIPVSTVGELKMRYILVRWQPNSRDRQTTVIPRSLVFFSISLPIWIDIPFPIRFALENSLSMCIIQKAWEPWPVTRPTTWGLRMPTPSRRATKNPRRHVSYSTLRLKMKKTYQNTARCLDFDGVQSCEVSGCQNQSASYALLIHFAPSLYWLKSSSVFSWCGTKIRNNLLFIVFC